MYGFDLSRDKGGSEHRQIPVMTDHLETFQFAAKTLSFASRIEVFDFRMRCSFIAALEHS